MTVRQFAVASAADIKWIMNSAALLRRRLRYNASEARWWGFVRLLTEALGLPLKTAAAAATALLRVAQSGMPVTIGADPSHSASIVVDPARYESIFLGNLSRACVHETPKRKGRPPRPAVGRQAINSAHQYGVDLGLIESALARTPAERLAMLEANALFLRDMRRKQK
ncbi:MAG: hypothetical protein M3Z54_07085 [Gemmatimonadota bacterium]|nr:hypothetical protein [Gemmatimonadota bacterium]